MHEPLDDRSMEIARLALAIKAKGHFFKIRRGLSIRLNDDIDGGGMQALTIKRSDAAYEPASLVRVKFDYFPHRSPEVMYEADLIMDQQKDYEPTVNRGNHSFYVNHASMDIDWNSEEAALWRSDLARLSQSPNTLAEWVEADLEMEVACGSKVWCQRWPAILTKDDLTRHAEAGLSLDDLRTRLTCSKCGYRGARIDTF